MQPDDQTIEKSGPSAYVGMIPAAGSGSRLPDRKLSKELLPVGSTGQPVIAHLLRSMHAAGVGNITVVLRESKWDLFDYLTGENWQHMCIGVRTTAGTSGVSETVVVGLDDNQDSNILFGFPDILFEPSDAFAKLMEKLETGNSDVVLGLFPTPNPARSDMVDADTDGKVIDIEIKPCNTKLKMTWILAAWKPTFTRYLVRLLRDDYDRVRKFATDPADNHLGYIFRLAIADGMTLDSVSFDRGRSLDIGTPEDLALAQTWTANNLCRTHDDRTT